MNQRPGNRIYGLIKDIERKSDEVKSYEPCDPRLWDSVRLVEHYANDCYQIALDSINRGYYPPGYGARRGCMEQASDYKELAECILHLDHPDYETGFNEADWTRIKERVTSLLKSLRWTALDCEEHMFPDDDPAKY